ncbi:hypothetical protein [Streptomyces sp. NPDC005970]|uniref:hypothetical protein n=1 Tax=Streptomyces sp. NPDC005970 TaxID=3156723 RepID=UPI0033D0030E
MGQRHLHLVVNEYAQHYSQHRPHRSLGQRPPAPPIAPGPRSADDSTTVSRHDRLGGLIHEYKRVT